VGQLRDIIVILSVQQAPTRTLTRPVVLVTGGLSGIGAATAVAFARLGARLVLADRNLARRDEVVPAVEAAGGTAECVAADVRDYSQVAAAAAVALERFGRIDVLLANAGIADQARVEHGDPDRWKAVVETNLLGTVYAVRAVLPAMLEAGSGHIFVVSSVSGREAYPGEAVYIASKWGQVGFAHALRQEVADAGVRVTLVEPGIVDTPLTRDNPVVSPLLEAVDPLRPEDVAAAILYAFGQAPHVVVGELTLRPLRQGTPSFEAPS
jgi:NADP-dependent 3-hydroxy acid dehydrogenase YdfG